MRNLQELASGAVPGQGVCFHVTLLAVVLNPCLLGVLLAAGVRFGNSGTSSSYLRSFAGNTTWLVHWEQGTGKPYYYNTATGISQVRLLQRLWFGVLVTCCVGVPVG
jgi:hypothetical protein